MRKIARNRLIATGLSLIAVVLTVGISAQELDSWTYDGVTYQLPRPRAEVGIPEGVPESHTVVKGDTLWGISGMYLNDNFLWPLVWDINMDTISNPHLIFPDQVVLLPGGATVMTPDTELTEAETEGDGGDEEEFIAGVKPVLNEYEAATRDQLIGSGYVSANKVSGPKIIGSEMNIYDISKNDIVYVNVGANQGVQVGDKYFIIRNDHKIIHPMKRNRIGFAVYTLGELEITCVYDKSSSALVTASYSAVNPGDLIEPWYEINAPVVAGVPEIDSCNPDSDQIPGLIVDFYGGGEGLADAAMMAQDDIVYLNVGSRDGVVPGDYFSILRPAPLQEMPPTAKGSLVVIRTTDAFSTARITTSTLPIEVGDKISILR